MSPHGNSVPGAAPTDRLTLPVRSPRAGRGGSPRRPIGAASAAEA